MCTVKSANATRVFLDGRIPGSQYSVIGAMTIPTEPIGSIPRPLKLLEAINRHGSSHPSPSVEQLYDEAVRDTIEQFEATGSPVVTDGEQRKYHNFATYCVEGSPKPRRMDSNCHSQLDTLAGCRG